MADIEKIHFLRGGFPLCGFTKAFPMNWPPGHIWSHEGDADSLRHPRMCPECKRLQEEQEEKEEESQDAKMETLLRDRVTIEGPFPAEEVGSCQGCGYLVLHKLNLSVVLNNRHVFKIESLSGVSLLLCRACMDALNTKINSVLRMWAET